MKLWGPYAIIRCIMLLHRRHIICVAPQSMSLLSSVEAEERCDTDRSHSSILKRQVGEQAVWGWVIPQQVEMEWEKLFLNTWLEPSVVCHVKGSSQPDPFFILVSSLSISHCLSFWHAVTQCLNNMETRDLTGWTWSFLMHDRIYRKSESLMYE